MPSDLASVWLAEIEDPAEGATAPQQALADAQADLDEAAGRLSAARRTLAGRLETAVTAKLKSLQMTGARLVVKLKPLNEF